MENIRKIQNARFITVYNKLIEQGLIVKNSRGALSKSAFAKNIGIKAHIINSIEHGPRNITHEQIELLCKHYKINKTYMYQGEGSPFDSNTTTQHASQNTNTKKGNIMLANMRAAATHAFDSQYRESIDTFAIPGIKGDCTAFKVDGDSMEPHIFNGDMVICSPIEITNIKDNEIYVIDAEGGIVIKRLQKITKQGSLASIKLISDNYLFHDPYILSKNKIHKIYKVDFKLTKVE